MTDVRVTQSGLTAWISTEATTAFLTQAGLTAWISSLPVRGAFLTQAGLTVWMAPAVTGSIGVAALAEATAVSDAFGIGAGSVSSATIAEGVSLTDTSASRIRTAARVPGAIGDCELTTILPGTGIRVTIDGAIRVAMAGDIRVTMETAAALSGTSATVPGAQDDCDLTVTVPGFDDDVTGYRVTMPGGPRVTLAGDVRISMAGAVRFTIPDETGAFRVTTAGNKRITLQ